MLFNSINFCLFLPFVVLIYYLLPSKFRWTLLLAASYFFYMCWNPYYVVLILLSTTVDFWAGLRMSSCKEQGSKKKFLWVSLAVNLGLLLFFKYFNFFSESLNSIFLAANSEMKVPLFDILLPVGISFYTFQTLSYTIDIYRGKRGAETHFGFFALYVSFFPQLIAGPIERSTTLLPQLKQNIEFKSANISSGLNLIIFGLFKKVVIADRLAIYVDFIYTAPGSVLPGTMILACIFFAFQIYCDFSGYSDIAIGSAKLLGINLMENFRRPYFALNLRDFWARWHISLSTWFRDYVYIPMGGNKLSQIRTVVNIIAVFAVSGLWHGANWTFVVWGLLHGVLLLIYRLMSHLKVFSWSQKFFGKLHVALSILITFMIVCLSWVFFRAESLSEALTVLGKVCEIGGDLKPNIEKHSIIAFFAMVILFLVEIKQEYFSEKFKFLSVENKYFCLLAFPLLILLILTIGVFDGSQFIYFQF